MGQRQVCPPMPASVAGLVEMGVNTLPVEHRDDMRVLIRQVAAQVWSEGHCQGRMEATGDLMDRRRQEQGQ